MPNSKYEIPCSIKVLPNADGGLHIWKAVPENLKFGLNAGEYTVKYDYPLSHEVVKKHTLRPEHTLMDLLKLSSADYVQIYLEEAESTKIKPKPSQQLASGMVLDNRNRTNGVHGIWGHVIDDLVFERIYIDTTNKTIEYFIGS